MESRTVASCLVFRESAVVWWVVSAVEMDFRECLCITDHWHQHVRHQNKILLLFTGLKLSWPFLFPFNRSEWKEMTISQFSFHNAHWFQTILKDIVVEKCLMVYLKFQRIVILCHFKPAWLSFSCRTQTKIYYLYTQYRRTLFLMMHRS